MNDHDAMTSVRGDDGCLAEGYRNPPLSETLSMLGLDLGPRRLEDDEGWPELGLDEPPRVPLVPHHGR